MKRGPRQWDTHFMSISHLNAGMSTCIKRHVGAVAVLNRRVLAAGFNGNLPGTVHCDEGGCERCNDKAWVSGSGLERCVCVHAEQNLVAWCARYGIALNGAVVYATTHPCSDCYKLLISAGVTEVVYDEPYNEANFLFGELPDINCRRIST